MTRIYLLRHGHVDNPQKIFYGPGISISERGTRQIRAIAEDCTKEGVRPLRIVSSPYVRTIQSADILGAAFPDAARSTDERLKEWQVGDWYGKPLADFYAYSRYAEYPLVPLPSDIEPLSSCAERVQHAIHDLVQQHPNEDVLIVSHREPLVAAILTYQNLGWETIHELSLHVASAWELTFENADRPTTITKRFDRSRLE